MIEMTDRRDPAEDTPAPPRTSRWAVVLTALVMFAAGVGIGWLLTSEPPADTVEAAPTATDQPDTTTAPPTTAPATDAQEGTDAEVRTEPLIVEPGEQPIATVAEAMLPSVVQIEVPQRGFGSGVIITEDGMIMTAAHVVEGQGEVLVRLPDGTRVPGQVLGADIGNDIALVEVDAEGLTPAPLAIDEPPRVGERAVALGSPWGLDATVTAGIVSALNQTVQGPDGIPRAMLQTDAAINPGNSGGPLVDIQGRVIGINVSIFSRTGESSGVGFAVPADRAWRVAQAIMEGGEYVPGFLGVRAETAEGNQLGAELISVEPGTAADEVGLQVGDVIRSVQGVLVTDFLDLVAQIRAYSAGQTVTLEVLRDGETFTVDVTLGEPPATQTP